MTYIDCSQGSKSATSTAIRRNSESCLEGAFSASNALKQLMQILLLKDSVLGAIKTRNYRYSITIKGPKR